MPQLLIFLALAALVIWLAVMLVWIVFVGAIRIFGIIVGLSVIVAGLAFLAGTIVGLIFPIRVMRGNTLSSPRIASAEAVHRGQVFKTAPPGASRYFGWDYAWPLYAPFQLQYDQFAVTHEARRLCVAIVTKTWGWWPRGERWFSKALLAAAWGILFGIPSVGLIAGVVVGTLLWLAITSVFRVLVSAAQKVLLTAMQWRESRFMKKNHAAVRCTRCYESTEMPRFLCSNPQCGVIHRDMAPGRLGILNRICGCEEKLPVTVANASQKLLAICPYCQAGLPSGSGTRRVVVVPVFGSVGVGKTQFLSSSAVALNEGGKHFASELTLTPLDDVAGQFLAASVQERAANQAPVKTQHEEKPEGYPYLVERAEGDFELHLMDAAGENFVSSDATTRLSYLDISTALVFLIDPLTIPEVREQLALSPLADSIQVAQGSTSDSYASVVDRLRNSGADMSKRQLAVVVTKADIISQIMPNSPLEQSGPAIEEWLNAHGEDRLMVRLRMDFQDVSFFAVSSTGDTAPDEPAHPLQVIDWTVQQHGGASLFTPEGTGVAPTPSRTSNVPETTEVGA